MLVGGLFLLAVGFVLTLKSRLGLNPWNVFHHGLTFHLPITWGQSNMLVGVVILGVAYALGAKLGAGTIGNMVLTGLFMDAIVASGVVPDFLRAPWVQRLVVHLSGTVLVGVGTALYIFANLGAGPRDSLMLALAQRFRASVGRVRTGLEVAMLALGMLLGGEWGIGTVIFALTVGPALQWSLRGLKER
jgi:uncharacterized membrane protein YczE